MQNKLAKNKLTMSGFLFFIAAFLLAPLSYAADQAVTDAMKAPPDATVDFDTQQFKTVFTTGRTGMGHINMGGSSYPFTARVKLGSAPMTVGNVVGEGKVWRAKKVGDFLGTYKPVGPGVYVNDRGAIMSIREKGSSTPPKTNVESFTVTFVDEVKD